MQHFAPLICDWYRQNHRMLPWRQTKNPYFIWISEVIMQQTRVNQGISYYNKFITHFPTLTALANADEQKVLTLWQGLGYYSRARNMHATAQYIVKHHQGSFPSTYNEILNLKGVGEYTAAAVSSFAFNLPYPVLDGNAFRVIARYFNEPTPIDTSKGKNLFKALINEVFDKQNPALFNQAIMELGAMVCTPKSPKCDECPLQDSCAATLANTQLHLPVKSKKIKITKRYFNYLIYGEEIQLEKRISGIWKNMYQLPLVEVSNKRSSAEINQLIQDQFDVKVVALLHETKHILSHQHIYASFWEIDRIITEKKYISILEKELSSYPMPRLIDRFFENYNSYINKKYPKK